MDTMTAETCVFVRPDGEEFCSVAYDGSNCMPENVDDFELQDDDSQCKLTIKNVAESDFGDWNCKAMVWDEWGEGKVELKKFREAEIEFQTFFGDVYLEAGIEQEFSCELTSESEGAGSIQWFEVANGRTEEINGPLMWEEDGVFLSSIQFTATVEDNGKTISCYNPQSGKDDHITLSVYMYQGPTGSLPPISVEEGKSAEIVQTFSSFPAPASDRVMWHLDLPEGMLVIHPGEEEHDGKYVAGMINNLGSNSYSITLTINDVTMDDAAPDYSLHIAVADTKNINLPFKLEVQEAATVVVIATATEKTPLPVTVIQESEGQNETVVALGPTDVLVKQESISIFIIIGIIALCIIICILYYASRCCDKKSDEEDIEKNTNRIEEPEIKPLIKKEEKNNLNVDVNLLNENLESKLDPAKKEPSLEESEALEETLNSLRDVINSPSPLKKEETKEVSEDQVDNVDAGDKPGIPNLKRVPTLPRDHPSHEDDKASIAKNARILRELSEDLRKKEKEEDDKQKSLVDVENNEIPIKDVPIQKKMLSRTSSFEIIRSKTVFLQNGEDGDQKLESTTMNIHPSPNKAKFEAIELKIQVSPAPHHPGGISYTRMTDDTQNDTSYSLSSSVESFGEENQKLISDSEADSSQIVLADVPVKRNKMTKDVGTAPLVQKPPVPPRTSNPTSPTRTTPDVNGTNLSRSNSITMEAGTQTPKIKARSIVYFDDDISASEESLSDAVAKEELQREIELLKQEVELAKKKLDNGGSIHNSVDQL